MNAKTDIKTTLANYSDVVDTELQKLLAACDELPMYQQLEYFLGFRDTKLRPATRYAGKRFRSALALMLADFYGDRAAGLPVAVSIELFHNFTLIHDDIFDGDELRRGEPTVWKLFGTDEAINSGDAQSLLATQVLAEALADGTLSDPAVLVYLNGQYRRVIEGQQLDFALAAAALSDPQVSETAYLDMIERKTAALISAAAKGAGLAAGADETEVDWLHRLGWQLGLGYQIKDDLDSIWAVSQSTGKEAHGDIYTRKKTLPIIHALSALPEAGRAELIHIYDSKHEVTEEQAKRVIELLDSARVLALMQERIDEQRKAAMEIVSKLSLAKSQQRLLIDMIEALLKKTVRS